MSLLSILLNNVIYQEIALGRSEVSLFDFYMLLNFMKKESLQNYKIIYCRCGNCFDCPSCSNTLVIRATSAQITVPVSSGSDETGKSSSSRKMHYLFCSFCRWTSRDAGLDDQPSGTS